MHDLLEEVARWKVDAEDETNGRYFVKYPSLDQIEGGDVAFVIGRKGSGKTAIADYLNSSSDYNKLSISLSFDGFPFNLLYDTKDESHSPSGQYILIWKYLIYGAVSSLMANNENVHDDCRKAIKGVINPGFEQALGKAVEHLTSQQSAVSFAGSGFNFGKGRSLSAPLSLSERERALETLVLGNIDNSSYLVLFDSLDSDYVELGSFDDLDKYLNLISSLLKAVLAVRRESKRIRKSIYPVVFLREDIFDLLRSPDKNKWLDSSIVLRWSSGELCYLIEQRLKKSSEYAQEEAEGEFKLLNFFERVNVPFTRGGANAHISTLELMLRATSYRPRDIIMYTREVARSAIKRQKSFVQTNDLKRAEPIYARRYLQELVDEIHPIIPNIIDVLYVLHRYKGEAFLFEDLVGDFSGLTDNRSIFELSDTHLINILYQFNVIGNLQENGSAIFRYNSLQKNVNLKQMLLVHKTIKKALVKDKLDSLQYLRPRAT